MMPAENARIFRIQAEYQADAKHVQAFKGFGRIRVDVLLEQRVIEYPNQFAGLQEAVSQQITGLVASATTDTTNADNISAGALSLARIAQGGAVSGNAGRRKPPPRFATSNASRPRGHAPAVAAPQHASRRPTQHATTHKGGWMGSTATNA